MNGSTYCMQIAKFLYVNDAAVVCVCDYLVLVCAIGHGYCWQGPVDDRQRVVDRTVVDKGCPGQ